jgi:hypothetical protein
MNTKMILPGVALALTVAGAPLASSQDAAKQRADIDNMVELLRKDVRGQKSEIIAKTMNFDAAQAATFWPIYKQYETERQAIGDERLGVIQDLAEHFDTLNDAKAKGLIERSFVIEQKRLDLEKKYKDEFLKVLPAKVVGRFLQVETRLNNLISLETSSQIPLVH